MKDKSWFLFFTGCLSQCGSLENSQIVLDNDVYNLHCTTAIKNSNGEFLLNGHFVVSMFKREIKVGGVVLEYSGSNNSVEKITCYEKITSNITVYVSESVHGLGYVAIKYRGAATDTL